ncbi:MAG TPA: hypothetical protein VGD25_05995, partial [Immundisolibacter sp.]
ALLVLLLMKKDYFLTFVPCDTWGSSPFARDLPISSARRSSSASFSGIRSGLPSAGGCFRVVS